MTFRAPTQDFRFVFEHIAGMPGLLGLPAFSAVDPDLIDAVLEENARFTEEVVAPTNWDGDQNPPQYKDGSVHSPDSFHTAFAQYAAGGWQGLRHPEAWGGQGLPGLLATATTENLYAANVAFSLCPMLTDGVIEALLLTGSEAQKKTYIDKLMRTEWTGTMNLTEPQAGSDLSLVNSRAVPQADGTFRISGQKIFITYGEHDLAENIIHLVLARTPGSPPGVKGISLFVVPKFLVNDDGSLGKRNDVWCASIEHKLGIHGSPTAVLIFGDGKGDVGQGAIGTLVGEENRGLEYMFIMMNAARFAVGVQGIGVSERATQHALAYARDRIQSRAIEGSPGPVAIVNHPDVQRMLMTMRALTDATRAIACHAAGVDDLGNAHPDDAQRKAAHALYDYLVPVVKGFSTECSLEVTSLGVQVHGGMGFIEETGAAQYYRDSRILTIYEGTTGIQSNDLVGRKTQRDAGAVAFALADRMQETVDAVAACLPQAADGHREGLALIAAQLGASVADFRATVQFVLDHSRADIRAVYAASVPYLMLTGYVLGGWHMARAALACEAAARDGNADPFLRDKFATAVFYAGHILPRTGSLCAAMRNSVATTAALASSGLV